MLRKKSNPGYGKAFTFHGSFVSLILARRREREIPGSFIHQHKGRYYVLKPKRIRHNPRNLQRKSTMRNPRRNPQRFLDWKDAHTYAQKLANDTGLDVAIRKVNEFGKTGYNVSFASKNDSDYARSEIVRTMRNPRKKRSCYVIPNPRTGTLIYGRVLKIFAQKTSGPFKGQRFVHAFKAGAMMYGMPDGSLKIIHK